MSHVTHMNASCHTYEWVMAHTWHHASDRWISHVTQTSKWKSRRRKRRRTRCNSTNFNKCVPLQCVAVCCSLLQSVAVCYSVLQTEEHMLQQHELQSVCSVAVCCSVLKCVVVCQHFGMGWLRSLGSIKVQVSFVEYSLFYRALLQKRPVILSILLTKATP